MILGIYSYVNTLAINSFLSLNKLVVSVYFTMLYFFFQLGIYYTYFVNYLLLMIFSRFSNSLYVVESLLSDIIRIKMIFQDRFFHKLKQCCSGRLC